MKSEKCSECGKLFQCENPGKCCCSDFPHILPLEKNTQCLCNECLINIQNEKINQLIKSTPLDELLKIVSKFKNENIIEKLDYTIENGQWVFSKWYHLKRGFCCYKGCINCPY